MSYCKGICLPTGLLWDMAKLASQSVIDLAWCYNLPERSACLSVCLSVCMCVTTNHLLASCINTAKKLVLWSMLYESMHYNDIGGACAGC